MSFIKCRRLVLWSLQQPKDPGSECRVLSNPLSEILCLVYPKIKSIWPIHSILCYYQWLIYMFKQQAWITLLQRYWECQCRMDLIIFPFHVPPMVFHPLFNQGQQNFRNTTFLWNFNCNLFGLYFCYYIGHLDTLLILDDACIIIQLMGWWTFASETIPGVISEAFL